MGHLRGKGRVATVYAPSTPAVLLLTFLGRSPTFLFLNGQLENRLVVKKSFSKAIVHGTTLSKDSEDLIVVFMLSNVKDIFKVRGTNTSARRSPVVCSHASCSAKVICSELDDNTHSDTAANVQ